MRKPIIVGYDPQTFDRAPVNFAVGAARFTGAPLVIACVCAGSAARDRGAAGRLDEDLAADASGALDEVNRELDVEGIAVEFRQIDNTSAARAARGGGGAGRWPACSRLDEPRSYRTRAPRFHG